MFTPKLPSKISDPPPVRPGDRVGVAALSGLVDSERLARGVEALRQLGYEPVLAPNLARRDGLFAGNEAERLDGFHQLVGDESLSAIFFARGGHGLLRLVERLDWDLIGRRPRAYVGYSDLTPLLLGVVQRLGWVAFHGPMIAADLARGLSSSEAASLRETLAGDPWRLAIPRFSQEGAAEGPLVGGCLSLLSDTVGTPWAAALQGAIGFLEDVDEGLYRFDRMLLHLKLSGTLPGLVGMLFGHVDWRVSPGGEPPSDAVVARTLGWLGVEIPGPIGWSVPAGHRAPNMTLPLGARVRVDSSTGFAERI